jgi:hypothetical protein
MPTTKRSKQTQLSGSSSVAVTPLLQAGALPLQLVLQHASDGFEEHQQTLCSLLCSSKAVRKALMQHCKGLVPVGLTGNSAECHWLTKYGILAKELHMALPTDADQQQVRSYAYIV